MPVTNKTTMRKPLVVIAILFYPLWGFSQQADTTKGSIPSKAELAIEKALFRIQYHSPAVRGRVIWGGLIAYDQVWVTGAHRATIFEFNVPAEIAGTTVKAGKYSLFTIPGKESWIVIINKNWDQHLADDYAESDDVLRFTVFPAEAGNRNRLNYNFEKISATEIQASMHWEKLKISFPIKLLTTKPTYKMPKKVSLTSAAKPAHNHDMTHAFSRDLPMNRNGSGTGWLPDETPMYAWMKNKSGWSYMAHGGLFIRQNWQNVNNNYTRGSKQFDAPGWAMVMAQKKSGANGLLMARAMITSDPITVGGSGYPLLLQSGETYDGKALVDRQHPHDFISELAIGYTQRIRPDLDLSVYVGYPGEPSLGPTAFMHRTSSMNNPDAPLAHHWQDATHITFGVATVGVRYKKFKLEGSSFTGREPDEFRFQFDKPRFNSYSYRLSYAPSKRIVLQASQASIKSPESLKPDEDVKRTTASMIYSNRLTKTKLFTSAVIWGYNDSGGDHKENSILWEGNLQANRIAFYSRYEWIQKSNEELQITLPEEVIYTFQNLSLGLNYQIGSWLDINTVVGIQSTMNFIPSALKTEYGTNPISFQAYIRFVPALFN